MDSIQKKLLNEINSKKNHAQKSSHWAKHTENFEFTDNFVRGIDGFSGRSRRYLGNSYVHTFLQKRNFSDLKIPFDSSYYSHAVSIAKKQHRALDLDLLRHVFTFKFLDKEINLAKIDRICIIGDGQSNGISLALASECFQKVISINLPEILMSDWELLKCLDIAEKTSVIEGALEFDDFFQSNMSLALIPASKSDLLFNQPIDLFINIASFQEMNKSTINRYFDIIKSSPLGAMLYACNRQEKTLYGGEVIRFEDYPWGAYEKVVEQVECPWHQHFYKFRRGNIPLPITRVKYDGIHMHSLVKYPSS